MNMTILGVGGSEKWVCRCHIHLVFLWWLLIPSSSLKFFVRTFFMYLCLAKWFPFCLSCMGVKKNPFQGAVNSGELCCEWVAQWAGLTAFSGSQLKASVPVQGERCPLEFSSDSEAACQLAQACWAFLDQHKHVRGTTYLSVALHPRGG